MDALMQGTSHKITVSSQDARNEKLTTVANNQNQEEMEALAGAVKSNDEADNDQGFRDDMNILQCFWMVTKMAVPLVIGMLLYLLV